MEKIIKVDIAKEHQRDMSIYAIQANIKRVAPDVRDGLKPVQRRTLDVMANDLPCKTTKQKTARVNGIVIGKSHPHGDTSVKDAIKLMANWFDKKMPLIYSESNMGSMQGDKDASARYTEIMLSKFCVDAVVAEMSHCKNVVDWLPTYTSQDILEPEYFPVAVPLLLINGTSGIGVGMKVDIPPHNLNEVIDATINLIKNPSAPVVLIPDHCMPCEIVDTNWKTICNKGIGKYTARAKIDINTNKNGRTMLTIRSTPDGVYYDKGNEQNGGIKYSILKLIEENKIHKISKIEEDSYDREMRINIILDKNADAGFIRDELYNHTDLQKTYSVNFEVVSGTELKRFSYKSYLQLFIEQRKTIKFRLACIELQKVRTRIHELEPYIKIYKSNYIDEVIRLIRKSGTTDNVELDELLIKKCGITDIQAKYISNLNLRYLSNAYVKKFEQEVAILKGKESEYLNIIENEDVILNDIIKELEEFKSKYGSPRMCKVISKKQMINIPKGTFKIVITNNNFIKKINPDDVISSYRGDNPKYVLIGDNAENILLFSTQSKVFKLPISKIPFTEKGNPGIDSKLLIKGLLSDICAMMYEPELTKFSKSLKVKYSVLTVTRCNLIKRVDINDFLSIPPSGLVYTKLNSGDFVKEVAIVDDNSDVLIYSKRKALRFKCAEIPKYRRATIGVTAMNLASGEFIDGAMAIRSDITDLLVLTESGRCNRINIGAFPIANRNKTGSNLIKLSKTDNIFTILGVNNNDSINIVTQSNKYDINVADIPYGTSLSIGTKLLSVKGDIIIKCKLNR